MDAVDEVRCRQQLDVIAETTKDLDAATVRHWLIGGWAIDFHLGRVSRNHSDIDFALWRTDCDRLAQVLRRRGYRLDAGRRSDGVDVFEGSVASIEVTYLVAADDGRVVTPGFERWPYQAGSFADDRLCLCGVEAPVMSAAGLLDTKRSWQRELGEQPRAHDLADIEALDAMLASSGGPRWRLVLLGDGLVEHDGSVVGPLSTGRVTRLLGRVALAPSRRIEKARLAFELWPDSSEGQARTNLRKLLHEIRAADIGDVPLLHAAATHVRLDPEVAVDALEVRDAIQRGDGASAARAYTGSLMTSSFDDWVLAERDALRIAAAEVIEASASRSDDPAQTLALARAVIAIDPLRVTAYRLAMGALVAQGERAEALRTYHQCAELLQRELGIEPEPELVAAYEAIRGDARPHTSHRASGGAVPTPHSLVGRAVELAALEDAWQEARRGVARIALVTGEPGIGKSRLVAELARGAIDGGASVAATRVYETAGHLPFGPVADWLRSSALRPGVGRLDPIWRREVARLVPDLVPMEHPPREGDPAGRRLLLDALAAAVVTTTPAMLVLDDLQWCDDDTIAFLGHLLHRARDVALMVATTARSTELAARPKLTAFIHERARTGDLVTVELGPLDRAGTLRLATSLPGGPSDDDEAQRWWSETEGNPLFVVELAKASQAGASETLPPTVRDVISGRLAVLASRTREVAEVAATIGRTFSTDVLERATGLSDDDLADHLDELWQLGIIREHDIGYDFTHDKLREVLATTIGPARRRRLHRQAGEALTAVHAGDIGAISSELAAHLSAAGRPAEAVQAYRQAARHALDLFALDKAIDDFAGAIRCITELPQGTDRDRMERDVLIELGVPLVQQTGYGSARALATYERAAELSRRLGEAVEAEVLRGIGLAKLTRCEFDQSIELAQQLIGLGADADAVAAVEGHYLMGVSESWRGRLDAAAHHLAAALDAYRPQSVQLHLQRFAQDPRPIVEVRLAIVRWWEGRGAEAADLFAQSRDHADASGHPATLLYVVAYRCIGAIEQDDVDAVEAAVGELEAMLERHGEYTYFDVTGQLIRAWVDFRRQRAVGLAALERSVDGWRGELRLHYTYALRLFAEACVAAGRIEAGLEAVTEGIRFGRHHDQRYAEAPLRLFEATLRTDGGDPDGGREALRQALDIARVQGNVLYELRAAERLARLGPGNS